MKKMLIYTNESSPAALKLLIAAKWAKTNVSTKIVKPHGMLHQFPVGIPYTCSWFITNTSLFFLDALLQPPKHLPYLEVNEDLIIFIPNAALWYLLQPPDDISVAVTEWLEWEASILSPILVHVFGGGSKSDSLKSSLINALIKLNKGVENKSFLSGTSSLNVDDIAVWCSIYPMYLDTNLCKQYLDKNTHIVTWIRRIEELPEIQEILENFKIVPGSYQALLVGAKYPVPVASGQQGEAILHQSPQHQSDGVTEAELEKAKAAWSKNSSQETKLKPINSVVLPSISEKNILITSALPYVNNVPHLGNIIGCVLSADVFARFCRICNYNTLYIGGTDEYGTATETKALEEGLSCQAICDKYYAIHRDIYEWFNISFDYFGRSSAPEQTE